MQTSSAIVFVIDDDLDVCDSLEAVIATLGYQCVSFPTAELLLEAYAPNACHCLIIDVNLPVMTGIEMLTELRRRGSHTPAILYTGNVDEAVRRVSTTLGSVSVILKGDSTTKLTECLTLMLMQNFQLTNLARVSDADA